MKQPKKSLLQEAPNLPAKPEKPKVSREERVANLVTRLANRLPSPHKETLLQIAEGIKAKKIQLLQQAKKVELKPGATIKFGPFGEATIVDVIQKEGTKRVYLKVRFPNGETGYLYK